MVVAAINCFFHRYDFEYEEDDDDEEAGDVDIENQYYNAKQTKLAEPETAIEEFLGVLALEQEKGEWGFKGLKQAIKLEFKLGRFDKVRNTDVSASRLLAYLHLPRQQNITPSSSHTSNLPLQETIPRNPSTICWTTSRRAPNPPGRSNASKTSTP